MLLVVHSSSRVTSQDPAPAASRQRRVSPSRRRSPLKETQCRIPVFRNVCFILPRRVISAARDATALGAGEARRDPCGLCARENERPSPRLVLQFLLLLDAPAVRTSFLRKVFHAPEDANSPAGLSGWLTAPGGGGHARTDRARTARGGLICGGDRYPSVATRGT